MIEIYARKIEEDLARMGIFYSGSWDETGNPKINGKFERFDNHIVQILSDSKYKKMEEMVEKGKRIVIYGREDVSSAFVNVRTMIMLTGFWTSDKLTGYGPTEIVNPVLEEVEKFYRETAKFTVERR